MCPFYPIFLHGGKIWPGCLFRIHQLISFLLIAVHHAMTWWKLRAVIMTTLLPLVALEMALWHTSLMRMKCGETSVILCICPANERWCYNVTLSPIGWLQTQNDHWVTIMSSQSWLIFLDKIWGVCFEFKVWLVLFFQTIYIFWYDITVQLP